MHQNLDQSSGGAILAVHRQEIFGHIRGYINTAATHSVEFRFKTEQKHKKMLKMKVDPDELLKTKGLKNGPCRNPMSYRKQTTYLKSA
jgi:hypothetical protein